jgi:hypothetical protein
MEEILPTVFNRFSLIRYGCLFNLRGKNLALYFCVTFSGIQIYGMIMHKKIEHCFFHTVLIVVIAIWFLRFQPNYKLFTTLYWYAFSPKIT